MKVASFYRFLDLEEPAAFRDELQARCVEQQLLGTILVAAEGFNGSLAGEEARIRALLEWIQGRLDLDQPIEARWNDVSEPPFRRMRVRLKKEIVTMGVPEVDPRKEVGTYVEPAEWDDLIADPETILIDTRNDYEVAIGTFAGAEDPGTPSFRDFPAWWDANRHRFEGKRIAMFCTGGIRCEKSTNYLLGLGVERSPVNAAGERRWFLFYGAASTLYRLMISLGIALFLIATVPTLGVLLAAWLIAAQVLLPLARQLRFLLFGPTLSGRRLRSLAIVGGLMLGMLGVLALIPFPSSTKADGVVLLPDQAIVRASIDGFQWGALPAEFAGQADAVRLGIARALVDMDEDSRPALRSKGLLTRDSRKVERKKPGRPKARKRFQFSKR